MSPSPEISLYNSYSKKQEVFDAQGKTTVSMYHCGPTVYKRQHLGNMRRFLFADILRRTFEFAGYTVKDVTNITDVGHLTQDDIDAGEDKLAKEATVQKTTPQDIAERETDQFLSDIKTLNIKPATEFPKATDHVEQMHDLIEKLLGDGIAYQTESGIYFDISQFPRYGTLSGNTPDMLADGKRIAVREEKKHPGDFALWIFDSEALQRWDSPWGEGYPGWHIECSAMSAHYLDLPIDIHTGGEDNKFPHHENEIAQSEALGQAPFVRYWLHNAHLQLEGRKLAKSADDKLNLDSLREKGVSPLAFRLFAFTGHYRSPLQFSWDALAAAQEHLESTRQLLRRLREHAAHDNTGTIDTTTEEAFGQALFDDLNTPSALAVYLSYISEAHAKLDQADTASEDIQNIWTTLFRLDTALGIIEPLLVELEAEAAPDEIQRLAQEREKARAEQDFSRADELRHKIEEQGYTLEDTPEGPRIIPQKP